MDQIEEIHPHYHVEFPIHEHNGPFYLIQYNGHCHDLWIYECINISVWFIINSTVILMLTSLLNLICSLLLYKNVIFI